jgi:hypothetical protein
VKKTRQDTATQSTREEGSRTQNTGRLPIRMSLRVPPPMPVTVPSRAKPVMSISLREATSAPEMAKATRPSQSRAAVTVSKSISRQPYAAASP